MASGDNNGSGGASTVSSALVFGYTISTGVSASTTSGSAAVNHYELFSNCSQFIL
jgi:hypothetical protein